jgi:hypothetical protein
MGFLDWREGRTAPSSIYGKSVNPAASASLAETYRRAVWAGRIMRLQSADEVGLEVYSRQCKMTLLIGISLLRYEIGAHRPSPLPTFTSSSASFVADRKRRRRDHTPIAFLAMTSR